MNSPRFLIDETLLRRNLATIRDVGARAGAEFIVALKANATWTVFPIMREYVGGATASSLAEARLVYEEFGARPHVYAPVYNDREIDEILRYASHITFNSLAQLERFGARAREKGVSCGVRINPGWSPVETELYNPCSPGSRLGVEALAELPEGVEGLHFHSLFESVPQQLERTLAEVEARFGHLLPRLRWLNMGGGHLVTHKDYDTDFLVELLVALRKKYPNLHIILEPGSAFTWQTGVLEATVEDIVGDTLMVDVSFACHMPDCLEMPYKPVVRGAHDPREGEKRWRIGGNSCLAGDVMGDWAFDAEPGVGSRIVFEDMIHYTMVKTTMFNGVSHPAIALRRADGTIETLREFGYEDYKNRMS
jgi:carboxynorspermidine decarboxylase